MPFISTTYWHWLMNIHLLNTRIEAIKVHLKSKQLSYFITPAFMSISMLAIEEFVFTTQVYWKHQLAQLCLKWNDGFNNMICRICRKISLCINIRLEQIWLKGIHIPYNAAHCKQKWRNTISSYPEGNVYYWWKLLQTMKKSFISCLQISVCIFINDIYFMFHGTNYRWKIFLRWYLKFENHVWISVFFWKKNTWYIKKHLPVKPCDSYPSAMPSL